MPNPPTVSTALPVNHLARLLPDWSDKLRARNLSKQTIASYQRCALNLLAFLGEKGMPQTATGIAAEHIEAFIVELLDTVSTATAAKHYRSLQQLFKWLFEEGEIERNPFARMKPPKIVDNPPDTLSDETVEKLRATCRGNTYENKRDLALITFMFDTGLRVGEIVGMTVDDFDRARMRVLLTGKGGKKRKAPVNKKTQDLFLRYLRMRAAHPFAARDEAFWLGRKGGLTVSGIAQLLERRCIEAGVPKVHPHQFRHTWANNFRSDGGNDSDMMELAGWSSRDMPTRYGRAAAQDRAVEIARGLSGADRRLK